MLRPWPALVLFVVSTRSFAAPATQPAHGDADVPVKEVVLFSSGVGYFEHFGTIKGDGATELRFKTEQVNDVLKSLLLEDLDGGKVGTVSYPSQAPVTRTLKSFQVDITDNPPLAALLNQLRGARLTVSTDKDRFTGIILGVEKKRKPQGEKESEEISVLNVKNGSTIRPVPLEDVRTLEMDDAKLNHELDEALSALAQSRDQDKKPVTIHFNGQGERRVRLGYVVETPIWKTSYRLVLGDAKKGGNGKLQGWAIVENQTDNDWDNVQLSLVSGRPISFIQDLYHSLYVPRPIVQPELNASLTPQTYANGITKEEVERLQQARAENDKQMQDRAGDGGGGGGAGGATVTNRAGRGTVVANSLFANNGQQGQDHPIDPTASVVAAASAGQLGELFQYTVGSVSIKRQQSAMIPIITDPVEVKKLSIYNRNVLATHPLNGARLKNTTKKHLLQGPVTVLEAGSYAGDARIDDVPPGQQRLLSYGVDLQVLVDAQDEPTAQAAQTAKLVKGVLTVTWQDTLKQTYVAVNKGTEPKTLVIEQPRDEALKLLEPAKAEETTPDVYRFERLVEPGKPLRLTVRQQSAREEVVALLTTEPGRIDLYAKLDTIPKRVRDELSQIVAAKQALADTQRQVADRAKQVAAITSEQSRIRENMKTVSPNNDYYARLVKKLDDQETQIERLQKDQGELQSKADEQRTTLEAKINSATIE